MWLSERKREPVAGETAAESGPVTVQGRETAVYLAGERRDVSLCAPGGFVWRPELGQEVLVLKAGRELEIPYILGVDCGAAARELAPGEIKIGAGQAGVKCGGQTVELTGRVTVNGESLEALISRVASPPILGG